MTAHSTALGLASLGRHGDDMIVHMNRDEVKGLQQLAQMHGTSLTINPHTGMPEAFSLGGVFKALLPIAAGAFMGPAAGAIFGEGSGIASFLASPLGAGLATGALTTAFTGNLGQGLMAGLGGASGASLGKSIAGFGANAASAGTTSAANQGITQNFLEQAAKGGAGNVGINNLANFTTPSTLDSIGGVPIESTGVQLGRTALPQTLTTNPYNLTVGADTINTAAMTNLPTTSGIGSAITGGGIPGTSMDALATGAKNVVADPAGFAKNYGYGKTAMLVGGAALGGVEPSDLQPNTKLPGQETPVWEQTGVDNAGNPTYGYVNPSQYNAYRTLNLGGPAPLNLGQAIKLPAAASASKVPSFATGGVTSNTSVGAGLSDLYSMSDGTPAQNTPSEPYGIGRLDRLASQESLNTAKTLGYADGGDVGMNLKDLPTLNVNTGANIPNVEHSNLYNRFFAQYGDKLNTPVMANAAGIKSFGDYLDRARPLGYAHGGYLDGQGDGMSDSIPATIEGKQPARLADGEFVVPADVVSHLGNGSSKAGSKRLYNMLDKVRKARTGTTKQGREINPNKFLPA